VDHGFDAQDVGDSVIDGANARHVVQDDGVSFVRCREDDRSGATACTLVMLTRSSPLSR
jgi:hypothetical protein